MEPYINPELAKALSAAMAEISDPVAKKVAKVKGTTKDGKPYDYEYFYADLADVYQSVRPALAKHGLFIDHSTRVEGATIYVATTVVHASGHCLPPVELGHRLPGSIQEMGGVTTYLRRYTLCLRLGIAAESDDDANDVDKKPAETRRRDEPPRERPKQQEPKQEPPRERQEPRQQRQTAPPAAPASTTTSASTTSVSTPATPAPAPAPAPDPTPVHDGHHPSFTAEACKAFHGQLKGVFGRIGLPKATYDDVKAVCAALQRPKPSQMDGESRSKLLLWLEEAKGAQALASVHYARRIAELEAKVGRRLTLDLISDWVDARLGRPWAGLTIAEREEVIAGLEQDSQKLANLLSFQETQEVMASAPTAPTGAVS